MQFMSQRATDPFKIMLTQDIPIQQIYLPSTATAAAK